MICDVTHDTFNISITTFVCIWFERTLQSNGYCLFRLGDSPDHNTLVFTKILTTTRRFWYLSFYWITLMKLKHILFSLSNIIIYRCNVKHTNSYVMCIYNLYVWLIDSVCLQVWEGRAIIEHAAPLRVAYYWSIGMYIYYC